MLESAAYAENGGIGVREFVNRSVTSRITTLLLSFRAVSAARNLYRNHKM
jgi:hypothetical protein